MPGFRSVFRCARCGNIEATDVGPMSACGKCGVPLHACIHCQSFDSGAHFECREQIPARVSPKDGRNECQLFSAARQRGARDRIHAGRRLEQRAQGLRRPVQVLTAGLRIF